MSLHFKFMEGISEIYSRFVVTRSLGVMKVIVLAAGIKLEWRPIEYLLSMSTGENIASLTMSAGSSLFEHTTACTQRRAPFRSRRGRCFWLARGPCLPLALRRFLRPSSCAGDSPQSPPGQFCFVGCLKLLHCGDTSRFCPRANFFLGD
jgi:hypothetical protein